MSVVPSQILYLEHGSARLYAEAIQVVDNRHLCWARPTLLIRGLPTDGNAHHRQAAISTAAAAPPHSLEMYALDDCPDLIWPLSLFQIAYDLDFFALLVQLKMDPTAPQTEKGKESLNEFIRNFWKAHTDIFQLNTADSISR